MPALAADGLLVLPPGGVEKKLIAVRSTSDGQQKWALPEIKDLSEAYFITAGAAVSGGLVFTPVFHQILEGEKDKTAIGLVVAFDLKTGAERWRRPMPTVPGIGLACDGRRLYFPSITLGDPGLDTGHLTCLERATGRQLWTKLLSRRQGDGPAWELGGLNSLPIVSGRTVLIRAMATDLFALDADTGKALWRLKISDDWDGDHIILAGGRVIYTEGGTVRTLLADGRGTSLPIEPLAPPATQPGE